MDQRVANNSKALDECFANSKLDRFYARVRRFDNVTTRLNITDNYSICNFIVQHEDSKLIVRRIRVGNSLISFLPPKETKVVLLVRENDYFIIRSIFDIPARGQQ